MTSNEWQVQGTSVVSGAVELPQKSNNNTSYFRDFLSVDIFALVNIDISALAIRDIEDGHKHTYILMETTVISTLIIPYCGSKK